MQETGKNVALVLGSGGARGIAHIAAIEELQSRGYNITSVAGCSMGSVVGGIFAGGELNKFRDWLSELDYWDVFDLLDFSLSRKGLIKGEKVFKKIAPFIADKSIENLSTPFVAVASDIINKKPVVYSQGNLKDAIRASVSIPTVLTPIQTETGVLVDGGIVNPLPVDLVKRNQGDLLVVVNLNAQIAPVSIQLKKKDQGILDELSDRFFKWKNVEEKKRNDLGMFDMMNESFDLLQETLTEYMVQTYKPDISIDISRKQADTMDFHRYAEIIEVGRRATAEALDRYESGK